MNYLLMIKCLLKICLKWYELMKQFKYDLEIWKCYKSSFNSNRSAKINVEYPWTNLIEWQ